MQKQVDLLAWRLAVALVLILGVVAASYTWKDYVCSLALQSLRGHKTVLYINGCPQTYTLDELALHYDHKKNILHRGILYEPIERLWIRPEVVGGRFPKYRVVYGGATFEINTISKEIKPVDSRAFTLIGLEKHYFFDVALRHE